MSKQLKSLIVENFKARFADAKEVMVVSTRGIDGLENNELRGALLEKQMHMMVVKNSLARRAFTELGMEPLCSVLEGPCTVVYGGDSVVDIAKEIVAWAKKIEHIKVKGGYLDGQSLDAAEMEALSKMPSRAELQGSIVMIANSPGSRMASAVLSGGSVIAGCLKTLIEQKEKEAA